jgi:hypothetical protein
VAIPISIAVSVAVATARVGFRRCLDRARAILVLIRSIRKEHKGERREQQEKGEHRGAVARGLLRRRRHRDGRAARRDELLVLIVGRYLIDDLHLTTQELCGGYAIRGWEKCPHGRQAG